LILSSAKEALVITIPEITSVRYADKVIGLFESHNMSLIINCIRFKMMMQNEMMFVQDLADLLLAISLIDLISEDDKVIISTNKGECIVLEEHFFLSRDRRRLNGQ
jgi:septum site-determining protein MinD